MSLWWDQMILQHSKQILIWSIWYYHYSYCCICRYFLENPTYVWEWQETITIWVYSSRLQKYLSVLFLNVVDMNKMVEVVVLSAGNNRNGWDEFGTLGNVWKSVVMFLFNFYSVLNSNLPLYLGHLAHE